MVLHKSIPLQVAIQLSSNTACTHIPDENRLKYKPFQYALNNLAKFFLVGYFGLVRKISYEIFDLEANVPEAFDYCKANGMGSPNASPFTYMYVRARLLEYGWYVICLFSQKT